MNKTGREKDLSLQDEIKRLLDENSENNYTDIVGSLQNLQDMLNRAKILRQHNFKKSMFCEKRKGKTLVRWRTFLPDENGKKGKALVRSSEKDLDDAIVRFYRERELKGIPTFQKCYEEWLDHHYVMNHSSPNTKSKYRQDYNRFLKDTDFVNTPITELTDADIEKFLISCITSYIGKDGQHGLEYKAFGRLYGYIDNTFRRAYKLRIINENPMNYLEKSEFRSACKATEEKTAETELISDEHFAMILKQLYQDMDDNPSYFAPYAVELAALTGMRVAEIATLKWTDIDYNSGYITISRSDKDNRIPGENGNIVHHWTVEATKTKKKRRFPIDDAIYRSLKRIQKVQIKYEMSSEWVFPHEKYGWTHSSIISSCLKNKCIQLGLKRTYGISAFRKTLNSDMRMENAPSKLCASILGNTIEVNDQYYYYDTSNMDKKLQFVESVHKKRAFA